MTHTDLIEKLSKLDGPCRECDALIAALVKEIPDHAPNYLVNWQGDWARFKPSNKQLEHKWRGRVCVLHDDGTQGTHWESRNYTASIDRALTLAPEGCDWFINGRYNHAHVWQKKETGLDGSWTSETNIQGHGNPANPAIAITIASLRAIEAMGETSEAQALTKGDSDAG